jgi:hypothetical protein
LYKLIQIIRKSNPGDSSFTDKKAAHYHPIATKKSYYCQPKIKQYI